MEIEELVDEVIELCYHSAVVSDDPYTQERATHAGVWDLIERYTAQFESDKIAALERELAAWREG